MKNNLKEDMDITKIKFTKEMLEIMYQSSREYEQEVCKAKEKFYKLSNINNIALNLLNSKLEVDPYIIYPFRCLTEGKLLKEKIISHKRESYSKCCHKCSQRYEACLNGIGCKHIISCLETPMVNLDISGSDNKQFYVKITFYRKGYDWSILSKSKLETDIECLNGVLIIGHRAVDKVKMNDDENILLFIKALNYYGIDRRLIYKEIEEMKKILVIEETNK